MIRSCAAAVAVLILPALALTTPALAQDRAPDRPSITVIGEGRVETPPDSFRIIAALEGRGADQVSAVRALAAVQTRVADVEKLEGLRTARLTTGTPNITPTFDPQCDHADQRDADDCPIVGYVARMGLTLEAGPVDRAGDALSLASERGSHNARVESFYLADDGPKSLAAQRAAFADARRQADTLAAASNQRIVRVLRLQDTQAGNYRGAPVPGAQLEEVVVTGARVRPAVRLDVAPPPIRTEARVLVTFEIE
jgi:uncharacterized protein YggE